MRLYPRQSFVLVAKHTLNDETGRPFCEGSGRRTVVEDISFNSSGKGLLDHGCGIKGCTNTRVEVELSPAIKAYRR